MKTRVEGHSAVLWPLQSKRTLCKQLTAVLPPQQRPAVIETARVGRVLQHEDAGRLVRLEVLVPSGAHGNTMISNGPVFFSGLEKHWRSLAALQPCAKKGEGDSSSSPSFAVMEAEVAVREVAACCADIGCCPASNCEAAQRSLLTLLSGYLTVCITPCLCAKLP